MKSEMIASLEIMIAVQSLSLTEQVLHIIVVRDREIHLWS